MRLFTSPHIIVKRNTEKLTYFRKLSFLTCSSVHLSFHRVFFNCDLNTLICWADVVMKFGFTLLAGWVTLNPTSLNKRKDVIRASNLYGMALLSVWDRCPWLVMRYYYFVHTCYYYCYYFYNTYDDYDDYDDYADIIIICYSCRWYH